MLADGRDACLGLVGDAGARQLDGATDGRRHPHGPRTTVTRKSASMRDAVMLLGPSSMLRTTGLLRGVLRNTGGADLKT